MSNCKRIKAIVSEYIDGELTREQQKMVESHLAACKSCDEVIANVKALRRNLHELKRVETSPDFETILRTRIRIESGVSRRRLQELFWTGPARLPMYGMAAALIVIASIMVFDQIRDAREPAQPDAYINYQWYGGTNQQYTTTPVMQQSDNVIYVLDRMSPEDVLNSQAMNTERIDSIKGVKLDSIANTPKPRVLHAAQRTY
ncbi:zf-HC2 domain-containing protein [candidate division KSB1 bacterium]|nr:zf-HC2 domain-containing protein [candidate division KSB1 bacterium]